MRSSDYVFVGRDGPLSGTVHSVGPFAVGTLYHSERGLLFDLTQQQLILGVGRRALLLSWAWSA